MTRTHLGSLVLLTATVLLAAGSGGGAGGGGAAGRGLVLLNFQQASIDSVQLNERLLLTFSEAVAPTSVSNASVQIREGDAFGRTVPGDFFVDGAVVCFEPRLASLCDQSDSGLKPDTQYRVQVVGFPEEFGLRNLSGQHLSTTATFEFHTRTDTDPQKYQDQDPAHGPQVLSASPAPGAQAVAIQAGNRIVVHFTENLDPCSVHDESVLVQVYEFGDPNVFAPNGNGQLSGFSSDGSNTGSTADQQTLDPTTWGAGGAITSLAGAPAKLLCDIRLQQTFTDTTVVITPLFGFANGAAKFPENSLIVVNLLFDVKDFGGQPMVPYTFSFTTENFSTTPASTYKIANQGETAYIEEETTAAVDPDPRSISKVQAFMLFAGDGDNGTNILQPTLPQTAASGCLVDRQVNDATADAFEPIADTWLDTGSSLNTCANSTDGSSAVIWEFSTFHISSNVTVRIIGNNPAILLVQGDVAIDAGGRLLVRGDGAGASPRSAGNTGYAWTSYATAVTAGGVGVAGGGNGGKAIKFETGQHGEDGWTGYGSPDGQGILDGFGVGRGGSNHDTTYPSSPGTAQGGGGGGHGATGASSTNILGAGHTNQGTTRGQGGLPYATTPGAEKMPVPSAGSGGGGGGNEEWDGSYDGVYSTGGGSGGAGGGFVDLTCAGDMFIYGTIDAAGSGGGSGGTTNYYAGPGGGGGGAGGGIRLLTPNDIVFGPTTILTAAGGTGGYSPLGASGTGGPQNPGAPGANGRIVLEDGDSVISGYAAAAVVPGEGDAGFYRGKFNAARFKGGGLTPKATTDLIPIGNFAGFDPMFVEPTQVYGGQTDFLAGVPTSGAPGQGKVAILVEVRGIQMNINGTPNLASRTPWFSVGNFQDTSSPSQPKWLAGHPANTVEVPFPGDNAGPGWQGFAALNTYGGGGFEFIQVRFTMFLPTSVGPFDPGSYVDDWTIRFTHSK